MRNILLAFFLLISMISYSQVNAGDDQTICIGDITTLQGIGSPTFTFLWTSDPEDLTISDPTILTPSIEPSETTDYTLEGRSVSFTNLVVDGNFESGTNNNFVSSYTYSPGPNGLWNEGTYAITNDASYNHNNFTCDNDHTSGNGYFMAVNGTGTPGVVVWSTSVTGISPNTEYEFSTWVASLSSNNPAILQFRINGILMGSPFEASSIICEWNKFFEKWDSGSTTSADISIINQNTQLDGNDFSLDDINFSKVTYYYDECTVTVNPIPTSNFDIATQSCSADTVIINYTGTASATAQYNWDFDNALVYSGAGAGPYKVQWGNIGVKTVSLYVDDACFSNTTSKNINILQSPSSSVTADATTISYGTSTTLHGTMSGNPGPLGFEWDPIDKLQSSDILDPETTLLENSTLFTFTATDETNLCSSFDTVTVYVTGGPLTVLSITANPDTICLGDSTELTLNIEGGSGNYTTTWRSEPVGFDSISAESFMKVSPNDATTFFAIVTDGFSITPEISIQIVVLPQIEITEQPNDTLIEDGQTAIFSVTSDNGQTYQWQVSEDGGATWTNLEDIGNYSGTKSSMLTISNASENMSANLYRCLLMGKCDPMTSDIAELVVILSPDFIGELKDVEYCENDTIYVPCFIENFVEIDSFNLAFTFDTSLLQFTHLVNIHQELSSTVITQNSDSINLNWISPTGINIVDGSFFEFGFIANKGGQDSLIWKPNSVVRNSYGFFPILDISSANINIMALPIEVDSVISNYDSLNILDEFNIELEADGGMGNYVLWTQDSCGGDSIGNGTPLSFLRPEQTTTYFAKWINQCGISDCKQVTVKIIEQFSFAAPNAFTPNGDGINDEFGIISPSTLPLFEFYIFNRWGQLIFSSKNQYELWDGTYNGEPSSLGVYVWKAKYQYRVDGAGSEVHEESGTVTLIK